MTVEHPNYGPPPEQLQLVEMIEALGVHDQRVLDAFRQVRREQFVPRSHAAIAYQDVPIPIGHGQVTSQPSLIAVMIAALRLNGDEQVLEIGTGFGFQTALLARLALWVYSIERHAELAHQARANLAAADIDNAAVLVGDGSTGLPEQAPHQAIVVSAAAPRVPSPLAAQLSEGGRLVQPLGRGGAERVAVFTKRRGVLAEQGLITDASFVPLIGEHGL